MILPVIRETENIIEPHTHGEGVWTFGCCGTRVPYTAIQAFSKKHNYRETMSCPNCFKLFAFFEGYANKRLLRDADGNPADERESKKQEKWMHQECVAYVCKAEVRNFFEKHVTDDDIAFLMNTDWGIDYGFQSLQWSLHRRNELIQQLNSMWQGNFICLSKEHFDLLDEYGVTRKFFEVCFLNMLQNQVEIAEDFRSIQETLTEMRQQMQAAGLALSM